MSEPEKIEAQRAEAEKARKRRLQALIVGAVAAGGAFQLNGWQAQAHGNRSSHSATAVRDAAVLTEDMVVNAALPAAETKSAPKSSDQ
jgi:hypothetical protein